MKRYFYIVATFAATILAAPSVSAADWQCRNADVEISCEDGKCAVAPSHTPMSTTIALTGGAEICSYSGCWKTSAPNLVIEDGYLLLTSSDFSWSGSGDVQQTTNGAISLDISKLVATVMIGGFAHPMTCTKSQ